jgi:hypothetical protein
LLRPKSPDIGKSVPLRREKYGDKHPDSYGDSMRDLEICACLKRVTKGVAKIQQQPLPLVKLIGFDEPLLTY